MGRKPKEPGTEGPIVLELQTRHRDYLERLARQQGVTVEKCLEKIVRERYAADPTKAGRYGGATGDKEFLKKYTEAG